MRLARRAERRCASGFHLGRVERVPAACRSRRRRILHPQRQQQRHRQRGLGRLRGVLVTQCPAAASSISAPIHLRRQFTSTATPPTPRAILARGRLRLRRRRAQGRQRQRRQIRLQYQSGANHRGTCCGTHGTRSTTRRPSSAPAGHHPLGQASSRVVNLEGVGQRAARQGVRLGFDPERVLGRGTPATPRDLSFASLHRVPARLPVLRHRHADHLERRGVPQLPATGSPTRHPNEDNCALYTMTHSDQYTPQHMNTTKGLFFNVAEEPERFCHNNTGRWRRGVQPDRPGRQRRRACRATRSPRGRG